MQFQWDELKAASNLRKHGIAFEDAVRVFADPHRKEFQDRHADGEERWVVIGAIDNVLLVVVAYTYRDDEQDNEIIRIISARRAERFERRRYEQGRQG